MAITRRTDYAVRLMYELAQLPTSATLSHRDLCEAAEIPESFGSSLIAFLVEGGLVRAGGHRENLLSLARPADQIPVSWIVCACEPEFSISECAREPQSCPRSSRCGAHVMWVRLDQVIWDHLRTVTLADLTSMGPIKFEDYTEAAQHPCEERPDLD